MLKVTASPKSTQVGVGKTAQFSATVQGLAAGQNASVSWKTDIGTIDAKGLFTAPATAGSATVTASSQADPTAQDTCSVSFS